jgi:2-C-methyl-D-erythritol 2,4-cyclodiphosphate synthase
VGVLFPPDAERWAAADSAELVRTAVATLASHGWRPTSADLAIAALRPSIDSRRDELAGAVAGLLGIGAAAVSIKGTTTDGLGVTAGGGIAAWAVVVVEQTAGND